MLVAKINFKGRPSWLTIQVYNKSLVDIPLKCHIEIQGIKPSQRFNLLSPEEVFTKVAWKRKDENSTGKLISCLIQNRQAVKKVWHPKNARVKKDVKSKEMAVMAKF